MKMKTNATKINRDNKDRIAIYCIFSMPWKNQFTSITCPTTKEKANRYNMECWRNKGTTATSKHNNANARRQIRNFEVRTVKKTCDIFFLLSLYRAISRMAVRLNP